VNGLTLVEVQSSGNTNVYPVITDPTGRFSFAGAVYGKPERKAG
jgi:hypothetical protein